MYEGFLKIVSNDFIFLNLAPIERPPFSHGFRASKEKKKTVFVDFFSFIAPGTLSCLISAKKKKVYFGFKNEIFSFLLFTDI